MVAILQIPRCGVTGEGRSAPKRLSTSKFLPTNREKRGKENRSKMKNIEENKEKGKGKKKMKTYKVEKAPKRRFLFVCLFVFLLCFVLFCFVLVLFCFVLFCFVFSFLFFSFLFTFRKPLKVLGSIKLEISTGKKLKSRAGKKIGKSEFASSEKFSCYVPGHSMWHICIKYCIYIFACD